LAGVPGAGSRISSFSSMVDDIDAEYRRLSALGVSFTREPIDAGSVWMAVFDDTCGNLIQIIQMKDG
jgi:predicted enzyme related to lactoylglutathione lyase